MNGSELRDLHARTIRASIRVVSRVTLADLTRPTPCAAWDLANLLAHMVAQHRGFAAAARGVVTNASDWRPSPLGGNAVAAYQIAAEDVLAAFSREDMLDRELWLPEITTTRPIRGEHAIAAHLIDYVVHGWDVARTVGVELELDRDVVVEALRIAHSIPDGADRFEPDAAFGPAVPAKAGANDLDRIVAMLGRSPTWPD